MAYARRPQQVPEIPRGQGTQLSTVTNKAVFNCGARRSEDSKLTNMGQEHNSKVRKLTPTHQKRLLNRRQWLVAVRVVPKEAMLKGESIEEVLNHYEYDSGIVKHDYIYMSCIAAPSLEGNGGVVSTQWGVSCKGCQETRGEEVATSLRAGHMLDCGSLVTGMAQRLNSRRGFMEHFLWCVGRCK